MWDGSLQSAPDVDQFLNPGGAVVWTGSNSAGTTTMRSLGNRVNTGTVTATVQIGFTRLSNGGWINKGTTLCRRVYIHT